MGLIIQAFKIQVLRSDLIEKYHQKRKRLMSITGDVQVQVSQTKQARKMIGEGHLSFFFWYKNDF